VCARLWDSVKRNSSPYVYLFLHSLVLTFLHSGKKTVNEKNELREGRVILILLTPGVSESWWSKTVHIILTNKQGGGEGGDREREKERERHGERQRQKETQRETQRRREERRRQR